MISILIGIYVFVALCATVAMVRKWEFTEVAASVIVGLLWPVVLGAKVFKRLGF